MTTKKIYEFTDNTFLLDVLLEKDDASAAIKRAIKADLDAGVNAVACVPGFPDRALIFREKVEELLDQAVSGPDIVAIPLAY